MFVTAPPDIWYLKDTDGDGRADVRQKVYTGFGTQNQQAMVNNLAWGLDHWIYGAASGNGGTIRPGDDPQAPGVSVEHSDFRFDPETGAFELVSGNDQFGNTFDDWGNRFTCDESHPLSQAVLPRRELARNPYLAVPSAVQDIAGGSVPIFRISPVEALAADPLEPTGRPQRADARIGRRQPPRRRRRRGRDRLSRRRLPRGVLRQCLRRRRPEQPDPSDGSSSPTAPRSRRSAGRGSRRRSSSARRTTGSGP